MAPLPGGSLDLGRLPGNGAVGLIMGDHWK